MTTRRVTPELDEVDRVLLEALQRDGRLSMTDLARQARLGLSATRVRLRRLEEHGIITGFTARVDPSALGFTLRALVRMKVHGALYDKVEAHLAKSPQIVRCVRVTGESCYVMEVLAADMADLDTITSDLARTGSVTTDLVYDIVADRPVPVDGPGG
ncbi:Lrp/AsnC family transcriptional regulator [Saccharopolyspora erythraea]|uniref:Lrp/AsnC family transcriptional regulator n=1 Tax=Saccharopolyspora erythraea TaxID=1836 RepID=UPI001BA64632|nr:Lrp/AsnC family transcriptional regulator [Saccharopolyspora erythraea]QUH03766.1 Lrp/AsnC family transcriptional regulator [Saccharopolyspora erythraea]